MPSNVENLIISLLRRLGRYEWTKRVYRAARDGHLKSLPSASKLKISAANGVSIAALKELSHRIGYVKGMCDGLTRTVRDVRLDVEALPHLAHEVDTLTIELANTRNLADIAFKGVEQLQRDAVSIADLQTAIQALRVELADCRRLAEARSVEAELYPDRVAPRGQQDAADSETVPGLG